MVFDVRAACRALVSALPLALASLAPFTPVQADPLVVYTENYPPLNYVGENGEVAGIATGKVRQVLDAAGLDYRIKLLPWTRAMKAALSDDDALIYSLTRTPKREQQFDWLVPIGQTNFFLFVRADETRTVTPEALRAGQFVTSCVSRNLTCELLEQMGVPRSKIITIPGGDTADFRMVIAGRADAYISVLGPNNKLRAMEGFDISVTRPALPIEGKHGFYLASGLQVPKDVRDRIREAYSRLVTEGKYELADLTELN